jgi:hypothetical protein
MAFPDVVMKLESFKTARSGYHARGFDFCETSLHVAHITYASERTRIMFVVDRAGSSAFSRPESGTKFTSSYPSGFELVTSTWLALNP